MRTIKFDFFKHFGDGENLVMVNGLKVSSRIITLKEIPWSVRYFSVDAISLTTSL